MLEILPRTLLGGHLGSCCSDAHSNAAFWGASGGLGCIHAGHILVLGLVLAGFVERLLGNHHSLANL